MILIFFVAMRFSIQSLLSIVFATSIFFNSQASAQGKGIQIVNVSGYDPKEKQRSGRGYSENDVSALRDNGAVGLIARVGKGGVLDEKCAQFLSSSDKIGMFIGVYYRTVGGMSVIKQADQMVSRVQSMGKNYGWRNDRVLLCADFDAKSSTSDMIQFLDRVKARTGVDCVIYLENSEELRVKLNQSNPATKARLKASPYWAALYSNTSGACKSFPAPVTAKGLAKQYNVWSNWSFWQYGGVEWEGGRSRPKVYKGFSPYFGNLDRPVERNLFNGNIEQLKSLWSRHSYKWR
jgi:GH25 family lysozyme M1 (1,4-beta-N-acetylmuramidase)